MFLSKHTQTLKHTNTHTHAMHACMYKPFPNGHFSRANLERKDELHLFQIVFLFFFYILINSFLSQSISLDMADTIRQVKEKEGENWICCKKEHLETSIAELLSFNLSLDSNCFSDVLYSLFNIWSSQLFNFFKTLNILLVC